ncbi:DUF3231 family protein [Bacillus sp. FJAT-45037]|uniref:DUF3231 family protein n=1 Tax=Bacillus sp. FJAT-45037 TaxID=2011007 RepID=UPI000C232485|nr:DUF3231 family protein [Bacillus sp. FJAT-45037]
MSSPESIKLTSSEMASLWKQYISVTHSMCMLQYFIAKAEDNEVLTTLTNTLQKVEKIKGNTKQILELEKVQVPVGFSSQDVDVNAPRLFSDVFALLYIKNLSRIITSTSSLMHTMSTRKDIRQHFKECTSEVLTVFDEVSDVLLDKGLYVRPPYIEPPRKSDFVEDKDYLNGINLLGDQRNLNAIEISHVFGNIEANVVGNTITQAFEQTADKKEVRDFLKKAGKLSEKVITTLTKFLTSSHLPAPMPSETQVFSSSQPAFSDRLMMYQLTTLSSIGISDYATSLATSMRNDLKRQYTDFLDDTAKLGGEAQKLLIENSWLEQPPQQDKVVIK